jgi:DNA-binding response OmpR family regulator
MPNAGSGPTVLIIEDDEQVAHLLQFMLEREGFQVRVAGEGRAALEQAIQSPLPDIILLDVMLPFYSGFELIRLLRRLPGLENVPIIMLTARSGEADIARALDAGASDYILKPFQPIELMARLRRHLRQRV